MNIEDNTQKEQPNALFGLFDLIRLLLNNKKILVIFLLITLLINFFLYYKYHYEPVPISVERVLTAKIFAKSPIEVSSINLLNDQLKELQTTQISIGNDYNLGIVPTLEIFDSKYLFIEYYDLLTNSEIIQEVLISQGRVNNNTDQNSINALTNSYTNNIHKNYSNHDTRETPYIITINFNTVDYDLNKKFFENLILTSNQKLKEVFINNLNITMKKLSLINQNIIQKIQYKIKQQTMPEQGSPEDRELLILLKSHYSTALSLNIIKPLFVARGGGDAFSPILSPLFFQVGTEYLSEMIKSLEESKKLREEKIKQNYMLKIKKEKNQLVLITDKLEADIQFMKKNIKELIEISRINNFDELFLFNFNPSNITIEVDDIKPGVITNKLHKPKNYVLYILVLLIGLGSFIGFVFIKESYRKYKHN